MNASRTIVSLAAAAMMLLAAGCKSEPKSEPGVSDTALGATGDDAALVACPECPGCPGCPGGMCCGGCAACPIGDGGLPDGATAAPLDDATRAAVVEALDDERHARAMYVAVLAKFGNVRPFANTAGAEQRHAAMLATLLTRHGEAIPPDPWAETSFDLPATSAGACAKAVEVEKANIAMYDRLLETVTAPDVRAVFERLRDVSKQRHLPAFERHVAAAP